MFYISIYLVALGSGAYEPSLATFGSDQFDEEDTRENGSKQSFYSYFYVATNLGSLFSETIMAYIQNLGHWALWFWVSTVAAVAAVCMFFCGSLRYRHFRPCGNPISRFCQVIIAAWKKSEIEIPSHEAGLYEVHRRASSSNGGRKILHTEGFKFLDHAAIITSKDMIASEDEGNPHNPWRLCTITQVEEVKCVLRLLPIWLCTITFSGIFVQMTSLFVEQGASMRTTICSFHIPPASMTIFDIISVSTFILFYDKFIAPLYTTLTSIVPTGPSDLKKMGISLVIAMSAMVTAGLVEIRRREYAEEGTEELSSLRILWQIPQYILIGVADAFLFVGQFDFFGSQMPDGMKSLGIGLCMASTSIGSYLCSLILTVTVDVTRKGGKPGWIPPNLNEGRLERYFFLMAALTLVELAVYAKFAREYKCVSLESREDDEGSELVMP